jgi:hypothetical protein
MEPRQDQLLIVPAEIDFILAMNCRGRLRIARIALSTVALGTDGRGAFVNMHNLKLVGNISDISRPGLYEDHQERITVCVEGAEPLYAELRLPNVSGWVVGQKVLVVIVPVPPEGEGAH